MEKFQGAKLSKKLPSSDASGHADRCAAKKRDELATTHSIKCLSGSIADWRRSCQPLAAVRDFDLAYDRLGSKPEITAPQY
jgi:hypothetical protein